MTRSGIRQSHDLSKIPSRAFHSLASLLVWALEHLSDILYAGDNE